MKQRFTVSMVERSVSNRIDGYELTEEFIPSRKATIFKSRKILEHKGYALKANKTRNPRKYTENTVRSELKDSWITSATPNDKSTQPRTTNSGLHYRFGRQTVHSRDTAFYSPVKLGLSPDKSAGEISLNMLESSPERKRSRIPADHSAEGSLPTEALQQVNCHECIHEVPVRRKKRYLKQRNSSKSQKLLSASKKNVRKTRTKKFPGGHSTQ